MWDLAASLLATLVVLVSCVSAPQDAQLVSLADQLAQAQSSLKTSNINVAEACDVVGSVKSKLYGEPGLTTRRALWEHLWTAQEALASACGELRLATFEAPSGTERERVAHDRWQSGAQQDLVDACDALNAASRIWKHDPYC